MKKDDVRILVVDDDLSILNGILFGLEEFGYSQFERSYNGVQAVGKIEEYKPNLVFLDTEMPIMDGVDAYKNIKQDDTRIVIIGMSSSSRYKEIWDQIGADSFFPKRDLYLKPESLEQTIQSAFQKRGIILVD